MRFACAYPVDRSSAHWQFLLYARLSCLDRGPDPRIGRASKVARSAPVRGCLAIQPFLGYKAAHPQLKRSEEEEEGRSYWRCMALERLWNWMAAERSSEGSCDGQGIESVLFSRL